MTTYDYYDRPLLRWTERVAFRIQALTDHHPLPFLTGTDGLTWRQRRRAAEEYLQTMTPNALDTHASRARALAWTLKQQQAGGSSTAEPCRHSA